MRIGAPELITPARAMALLETNKANRRIRPLHIADLVAKIKLGQWRATHQGIALDCDGNLIDGQHRLWAVVESNTAVHMVVAYDCDPENYKVIDNGIVRSISDTAGTGTVVTAMCSALIQSIVRTSVKSDNDLTAMCRKYYGDLIDECASVVHRAGVPSSMRAAFVLRMADEPHRRSYLLDQLRLCAAQNQAMAPQLWAILRRNLSVRQSSREVFLRTYWGLAIQRGNYAKLLAVPFDRANDEAIEAHKRCSPELVEATQRYYGIVTRQRNAWTRRNAKEVMGDKPPSVIKPAVMALY